MAGTKEGGQAAAKTNKEQFGADWYKRLGKIGGLAHKTKPSGFAAMDKEKVREAGRRGGSRSKRTGVKGGEGTSRSAQYHKRKSEREPTAYELHTGGEQV
jgi:general stress protein YciG